MAKKVTLKFGKPHTSKNTAKTGGSSHINTHRISSSSGNRTTRTGTKSPYNGSQPVRVTNKGRIR